MAVSRRKWKLKNKENGFAAGKQRVIPKEENVPLFLWKGKYDQFMRAARVLRQISAQFLT